MKKCLCMLALLCLFIKVPAQDNQSKIASFTTGEKVQEPDSDHY